MTLLPAYGAALVLGLIAGGHCALMCGGISTALAMATAKRPDGCPHMALLWAYQMGRITSYSVAGLLVGGVFGAVIRAFDVGIVQTALRVATAIVFALIAVTLLTAWRPPRLKAPQRLWAYLAPLGRRLLPVRRLPHAFAFGMIWGWMPCGFVYSMLMVAALQASPVRAMLTMGAFGIGTAPLLVGANYGLQRVLSPVLRGVNRQWAGVLVGLCAALTLAGPWLVTPDSWLHSWLTLDCLTR